MNIETFRAYCLSKKACTEEMPFGPDVLVFKVMNKIFALTTIEPFDSINLKCDPEKAQQLREQYPCVIPGYHMNKKHWNTIQLDGSISTPILHSWIDHSYDCVVKTLTKTQQKELNSF
jgi:predicted DNA-binding protein (MmcQ/YjbR family)